jgi:3-dehydroquinate synthase
MGVLTLDTPLGPSTIRWWPGGPEEAGAAIAARFGPGDVHIVCTPVVWPLWGSALTAGLRAAALRAQVHLVPDGEAAKTPEVWARLCESLLGAGLRRDRPVLAFGGGAVGDLAGFAAAVVLRGVPFVFVPTTLLAMVDASVGGKTAINAAHGKNLIGAFHPASLVLAPLRCLDTLPRAERASGLGEVLKHAMLADAPLLARLQAEGADFARGLPGCLADAVASCVAVKAAIVAADLRDDGPRRLLNYGHTVGHAIEAALGPGAAPHGLCVLWGMRAETRFLVAEGLAAPSVADALDAAARALGLPLRPPILPRDALRAAAGYDKKLIRGTIALAVPGPLGSAALRAFPAGALDRMFDSLDALLEETCD